MVSLCLKLVLYILLYSDVLLLLVILRLTRIVIQNMIIIIIIIIIITARCILVQSAVLRLHVVCPSVCLSVTLVD